MTAEATEAELWQRYNSSRDPAAHDRLFLMYRPWATGIARGIHSRVRSYAVDRDDFIQNATIGLLEAMSRYDPGRGLSFPRYAKARVRGAVFNGLRAILGERLPPSEESRFASRLDSIQDSGDEATLDGFVDSIAGLAIAYMLDRVEHTTEGNNSDGLAYVNRLEIESRLAAAVDRLPERLRMIISAHYFQHVAFQDIADHAGVTKGRISQLHRAALERLRGELREL